MEAVFAQSFFFFFLLLWHVFIFKECEIVIYEGLKKLSHSGFLSLLKTPSLRLTRQRLYGHAAESLFFLDEESEREKGRERK